MITFKEYKKKTGYVKFQGSVMTLRQALLRVPENIKVELVRVGIHPNEVILHTRHGKYKIIETLGEWPKLRTRKTTK